MSATQKSLLNKTEACEREVQTTRRFINTVYMYMYICSRCRVYWSNEIIIIVISNRIHEEMNALKRKLEKYKQKEWSAMSDEVLVEEIKTYRVMDYNTTILLLYNVHVHVIVSF